MKRFLALATLVLLLASVWQGLALADDVRFHADEALYMTAARAAAVYGDWLLLDVLQDKPPLTMYMNALALAFTGVDTLPDGVLTLTSQRGEFAGRLWGVFAAVGSVALAMAIARRLTTDDCVALLTGLLMALSPYVIAFGATAFTDMPMLFFCLLMGWLLLTGRGVGAGVAAALAVAAKPQAVLLLPLLIALAWLAPRNAANQRMGYWLRFVIALGIGISLLLLWDAARVAQGAPSVWTLGQANYPALTIAPLISWPERLLAWLDYGQWLFGGVLLTLLLVVAALFGVLRRRIGTDVLLLLWVIGYLLVHIILTVGVYDRYLLLLVFPLALLIAQALVRLLPGRTLMIAGVLALLLSAPALQAAGHRLPVGGDSGRRDGIDQLATYLNQLPVAAVVYDPWLGWELGYYLGPWTSLRRVHYPTPEALIADALLLPETGTRYFVAPVERDVSSWLAALAEAGFRPLEVWRLPRFVVWALTPPVDQASEVSDVGFAWRGPGWGGGG